MASVPFVGICRPLAATLRRFAPHLGVGLRVASRMARASASPLIRGVEKHAHASQGVSPHTNPDDGCDDGWGSITPRNAMRDKERWRRDRDSNPGYVAVYVISSHAPSTTRPSLRSRALYRVRNHPPETPRAPTKKPGCGRQATSLALVMRRWQSGRPSTSGRNSTPMPGLAGTVIWPWSSGGSSVNTSLYQP